jgi:hypothetical protein
MPTLALIYRLSRAFGVSMTKLMSEVEAQDVPQGEPPPRPRGQATKRGQGRPAEGAREEEVI